MPCSVPPLTHTRASPRVIVTVYVLAPPVEGDQNTLNVLAPATSGRAALTLVLVPARLSKRRPVVGSAVSLMCIPGKSVKVPVFAVFGVTARRLTDATPAPTVAV